MEAAPLTLAHDHARAASIATQTSDTTVAINEHTLAAGEFAKAAEGTGSEEALRTLKLLEQHHQRLSQLLKFPTENPVVDATLEKTVIPSAAVSELQSPKPDAGHSNPRRTPMSASTLQVPRRMPARDMSSSIASNLASARGIRSSNTRRALSPSISTQQAPGSLEVPIRKSGPKSRSPDALPEQISGKLGWIPSISVPQPKIDSQILAARASPLAGQVTSTSDEGFHRFYNTFENLISKLSAPLAFAGLPLVAEETSNLPEPKEASPQKPKQPVSIRPTSAAVTPDLTKFISRAALRASAHPNSGTDSFYVVPTTGHTVSYANILSFAEKEKRRAATTLHHADPDLFDDPDHDDFVDAHETPPPPSPGLRRSTLGPKFKPDQHVVVEELQLENKSLKDCIDQLSRRLHAFEMSAQSSSLALQESMRLMRPASPAPLPVSDAVTAARIRTLEERVTEVERERGRLDGENEKLRGVVARYRERWEKLKEGAKTRRGEGGGSRDSPGGEKDGRLQVG